MDQKMNKASIHSQAGPELNLPGYSPEDRNSNTRFRFSTDKQAFRRTEARLGITACFGLMAMLLSERKTRKAYRQKTYTYPNRKLIMVEKVFLMSEKQLEAGQKFP